MPAALQQEAMYRACLRLESRWSGRGRREHSGLVAHLVAHRLLEACRRLAGRGGKHDPAGRSESELAEEGHDRGHGGGLPRTGTARHHAEPAGGERSVPPPAAGRPGPSRQRAGRAPPRSRPHPSLPPPPIVRAAGIQPRPSAPPPRNGRGRAIPPVHHERARLPASAGPGNERARGQRLDPGFEPRKPDCACARVRGPLPAGHPRQRKAGVPGPRPRAREGRRRGQLQAAPSVDLRHQLPEVPVDVREVSGGGEIVQHGCAAAPRGAGPGHGASPPRKQSSSACRQAAGGRSK